MCAREKGEGGLDEMGRSGVAGRRYSGRVGCVRGCFGGIMRWVDGDRGAGQGGRKLEMT